MEKLKRINLKEVKQKIDKLTRVLNFATEKGNKKDSSFEKNLWERVQIEATPYSILHEMNMILIDHEFSKAFFGEEDAVIDVNGESAAISNEPSWKWHLSQAIIHRDGLLNYYYDFIIENEKSKRVE